MIHKRHLQSCLTQIGIGSKMQCRKSLDLAGITNRNTFGNGAAADSINGDAGLVTLVCNVRVYLWLHRLRFYRCEIRWHHLHHDRPISHRKKVK